jgi:hypothetical protein
VNKSKPCITNKNRLSTDKNNNGKICRFTTSKKQKLLMASMLSGAKHGRKNSEES